MQAGNLWQAVLGELELSVSRANFMTWFKHTQLLRYDQESAIIGVPNVFIKQQLERRYNDLIVETLRKNGVEPQQIVYKIHTAAVRKPAAEQPVSDIMELENRQSNADAPQQPIQEAAHLQPGSGNGGPQQRAHRQGINERYTFDNFIVGAGNDLAYAACQAIAASPGTKYNPLFLYGGAGIGKTHLMQAVGNHILRNKAGSRVIYVTSEQFVHEFVQAIRFKKNNEFVDNYRGADVLIIDDVQFFAGKEKVQEEFFHTFNALHQSNKQIILSSDKPPGEIPTLEDRLKSRFVWGMSIDMQIPDFETRCAIIQTKAEGHAVVLPTDVVEYLANNVQTNIRELEGALNQLLAFCEMRGLEPNLVIASGLLGNVRSRPKHISAKQIIERTARHFQVSVEEILGSKRDKDIVVPRQVAMYILRSELHLSFPKIARELGRKDHTTAIHSVEKIQKEINLDEDIRAAVNDIKELLYA